MYVSETKCMCWTLNVCAGDGSLRSEGTVKNSQTVPFNVIISCHKSTTLSIYI